MSRLAFPIVFVGLIALAIQARGQEQRSPRGASEGGGTDTSAAPVSIHVALVEFLSAGDVDVRAVGSTEKVDALLKELGESRKLLNVTKIEVSTVDEREAMTQFGERAAVVSGRTRVAPARGGRGGAQGFGGAVASYSFEEIGTIVRATPHLGEGGRIVVELQIEKSDISPLTPQIPGDEDGPMEVVPPSVVRLVTQSTLRLEDGKTHVAFRKATSSPQGMMETIIFVTAQVMSGPASEGGIP